jgi:hypothetical protein
MRLGKYVARQTYVTEPEDEDHSRYGRGRRHRRYCAPFGMAKKLWAASELSPRHITAASPDAVARVADSHANGVILSVRAVRGVVSQHVLMAELFLT